MVKVMGDPRKGRMRSSPVRRGTLMRIVALLRRARGSMHT